MNRPKDINSPCSWNVRIWDEDNDQWLGQSDPESATYYGFDIRGGEVTVFQSMDWLYKEIAHGRKLIWERSTGLLDKNGEEIYEGDVVYLAGRGDTIIAFPFLDLYDAAAENDIGEILGNIHENGDLLK